LLRQAGFIEKPAKGSHAKWSHPELPQSIIISGKDGSDAKLYQEKQVEAVLKQLEQIAKEEKKQEEK
jgi:predicted RNA binding protein YcfA (HicA-like mRNA interferase family)